MNDYFEARNPIGISVPRDLTSLLNEHQKIRENRFAMGIMTRSIIIGIIFDFYFGKGL